MPGRSHGQIRRSQAVSTWGPGALLDLPRYAIIVGGLDFWSHESLLEEIIEPRLSHKLQIMTGITAPKLYAPPVNTTAPYETTVGIGAFQFPKWFVVQEKHDDETKERSRRLVHRSKVERGRFDGCQVIPTRFVRACPRGHVDDIDWHRFVHGPDSTCSRHRQLWLDESGTSGDLSELTVRCECGAKRGLLQATRIEENPLGTCSGARPWLGENSQEECNLPSRLLIRTAANSYFSQVMSVLSIPDRSTEVQAVVDELWDLLQIVKEPEHLNLVKGNTRVAQKLARFEDEDVLEAIRKKREGPLEERPVKLVELDAILAVPEGFGDDTPIDPDFHARRLPEHVWRGGALSEGIESVVQVHRLREVLALTGFTRFEAIMPDIQGEYETDVERAELALEPSWFPAVENRGEGLFIQLRSSAISEWLDKPAVKRRLEKLEAGHKEWIERRKSKRLFPGGPYVLLHTLSHLMIQSLAMQCGYPLSSIKERIYTDPGAGKYGILLFTGSPDAEGTLGGLVHQARYIESHLMNALHLGLLCSNDPICAQHEPGQSMEGRWLHGAACHGCTLVAETSCEMRNDYLDRALVVPTIAVDDAAFFRKIT